MAVVRCKWLLSGRGRVKLVSSGEDILEGSPAGQRAAARSVLTGKGISIITNGTARPCPNVPCLSRVDGDSCVDIDMEALISIDVMLLLFDCLEQGSNSVDYIGKPFCCPNYQLQSTSIKACGPLPKKPFTYRSIHLPDRI